jgi:DNA polymerase-3 subunit delta'
MTNLLSQIEGHDAVRQRFCRSLETGRLASTFLFVGPEGIGKRSFALGLSQALLCTNSATGDSLEACGRCESCRLIVAGTHPDLLRISRPEGKSFIPVELFIGPQEKRMREGLCHDIAMKPFLGGRKIALIDDADYLNMEGANSLLKTLEEPPPRCVMILIGTSAARQLPTIRSRCQIVRFNELSPEVMQKLILEQGLAASEREAAELTVLAGGSLAKASELAEAEVRAFRERFFERLSKGTIDSIGLAQELGVSVDSVGKDASARRARLRQVLGWGVDFYRELMRAASGVEPQGDPVLLRHTAQAAQQMTDGNLAAECVARCLEALEQLDRNANTSTLLACWLDDLERLVAPAMAR